MKPWKIVLMFIFALILSASTAAAQPSSNFYLVLNPDIYAAGHFFNGAIGTKTNDLIKFTAGDTVDPGLALVFENKLQGKLMFDYSGYIGRSDPGTTLKVMFISANANTDKDVIISSENINLEKEIKKFSGRIPSGTNKIDIMFCGTCTANIELSGIKIISN